MLCSAPRAPPAEFSSVFGREIEHDATIQPTRAFAPYTCCCFSGRHLSSCDAYVHAKNQHAETQFGNGLLASIHLSNKFLMPGSDFHRRPCTRHRPPGRHSYKGVGDGTDSNRFSGGRQAGRWGKV